MICADRTVAGIISDMNVIPTMSVWATRVAYLKPKYMVELGTGQGASGADIMCGLPWGSKFTTINYDWPTDYRFGEMLDRWNSDHRLTRLIADTTEYKTLELVEDGIDLLFIDTHHVAWQAATELELWQTKLGHGALVFVDDIDQNNMESFWASLVYDKERIGAQGLFRYDATRPYVNRFPRGKKPSEGWRNDE